MSQQTERHEQVGLAKKLTDVIVRLVILVTIAIALAVVWDKMHYRHRHHPYSHIQSDMRSMATALASYHLDWGAYPPWTYGSDPLSIAADAPEYAAIATFKMAPVNRQGRTEFHTLTTPISYITSYFVDPFSPSDPKQTFAYYPAGEGWILVSPGFDGTFDIDLLSFKGEDLRAERARLLLFAFDPTNGAESGGDIWKIAD